MAKLYRLVPDSITTVQTTGYKTNVVEDLFYNLGYVAINNERWLGYYRDGEGIVTESPEKGYFFFLNPWSCIRGLTFLDDKFCNRIAKILEYDIPDELLSECKNAFTNYESYQAKGIMIPRSVLKGEETVLTEVSDVQKQGLSSLSFADATETIEFLNKTSRFDLDMKLDKDKLERINKRRFENPITYFKTPYITGNKMLINRNYTDKMTANIFEISGADAIEYLISVSNGILTEENAKGYDGDSAKRKYGLIL